VSDKLFITVRRLPSIFLVFFSLAFSGYVTSTSLQVFLADETISEPYSPTIVELSFAQHTYKTIDCVDDELQVEKSYSNENPASITQIKACAEQGHAQSQYIYGNFFYNTAHIDNVIEQSVYWWTKAGQQNYGDAWYRLGLLYQNGYGYDDENRADVAKSAAYHQLGAIAGSKHAQYYLGIALYSGWGIKQDEKAAMYWWKVAADEGHQSALDAYTGSAAVQWYPVKNSPVWQLYNRVNNKSRADVFAILKDMLLYKSEAEVDLALAGINYPEPQYFYMNINIYQVLKYLPEQLVDMPNCGEFEKVLKREFPGELNSYFDIYIDKYIDGGQINSALWYALQRVCQPNFVDQIIDNKVSSNKK